VPAVPTSPRDNSKRRRAVECLRLSLGDISNGATIGGLVLALGILALTVGLIRSQTTRDLRTLTAAGATARTRRPLAGVTAGVLGLLGAALGTVAAMLAGAVFAHASIIQTFGNVPWSDVGLLVIGMPLTAAAAGWLLGGNHALVRDKPRPSARTGACLRLPPQPAPSRRTGLSNTRLRHARKIPASRVT
jgi:hypothetical protein